MHRVNGVADYIPISDGSLKEPHFTAPQTYAAEWWPSRTSPQIFTSKKHAVKDRAIGCRGKSWVSNLCQLTRRRYPHNLRISDTTPALKC